MRFVKCNDAHLERSSVSSALNNTPLTTTNGYNSLDTYIDLSRPRSFYTGFNINNSSSSRCNVVVLDTPHILLFSNLGALDIFLARQTNRRDAYPQLLGSYEALLHFHLDNFVNSKDQSD